MSPAQIVPIMMESFAVASSPSPSHAERSVHENRRFPDLRGVQWRVDLGILPSPSSIDDLRRFTADSRRRYATLRRHLLIDPHAPKDKNVSPDLVMDNPLSQNPDSMWGRFFQNAELERVLDQDLSRLYPEHENYFQSPGCQGILRRILLLWCLRHPEHGYRQGMHELLAPLLYVLHVDVEHLTEVRNLYEDHFTDRFDGFSFHESDLSCNFDFKKLSESIEGENDSQESSSRKVTCLNELDAKIQAIVLLSDAYGAEGELGIVLSEKFMEHDAYAMFEALMSGANGAVAMAEFFSTCALDGSHTGLAPVIEASSALYHLLSIVDSSLHSHLVEIGVEPQYFGLRWLRVLFGREFELEDLLIIWDEIFASDNHKLYGSVENDGGSSFGILASARGAFISAFAVSMILHLRSSLLATENATSCLQRLLNFPANINLMKLIVKAKSLQMLALDANNSNPLPARSGAHNRSKSMVVWCNGLPSDFISPRTPLLSVPDKYWEEKWSFLHKAEELNSEKWVPNRKKSWPEKLRSSLSRTESAPVPATVDSGKKDPKLFDRRTLQDDLLQKPGLGDDLGQRHSSPIEVEVDGHGSSDNKFTCHAERKSIGNAERKENYSIFSDPPSPQNRGNDRENESVCSFASNISTDENDVEPNKSCGTNPEGSLLLVLDSPKDISCKSGQNDGSFRKQVTILKERKPLSGKLQWLRKFGRRVTEDMSDASDATKASNGDSSQSNAGCSSTADEFNSSIISKGDDVLDHNVIVTLRNIGQSMLENIEVIESVFEQDQGQMESLDKSFKKGLVGRGRDAAIVALKELREISNLLSEMRLE